MMESSPVFSSGVFFKGAEDNGGNSIGGGGTGGGWERKPQGLVAKPPSVHFT